MGVAFHFDVDCMANILVFLVGVDCLGEVMRPFETYKLPPGPARWKRLGL